MQIRKVLSVILVVSILFSVTTIGFSSSVSAQTINTYSTNVSLTFDGDEPYGIPATRGTNIASYNEDNGYLRLYNVANNGGTAYIGKKGTVGQTIYNQYSGSTQKAEARENLFYCQPGKTYRVKFDYKYLAGTGGTNRGMQLWLVPDPTASSISSYNLADRATLIESQVAKSTWATEATVLTEDLEWATAYYTFTVKETLADGSAAVPVSIGMHTGYNANYDTILAIDNLTVSEVSSFEYYESRLHTMEDATQDAFILASGFSNTTTGIVDGDEEHGKVLKAVGSNYARLGFEDFDMKQGRKYYVYFDAKAETDNAQPVAVMGVNGGSTSSCRYFFTGFQDPSDTGISYYIDGQNVKAANFKFSTEWRRYGFIIDTSNETLLSNITSYQSNYWTKKIHFLFGVSGATAYFDNIQLVEVESIPDAVPDETKLNASASIRVEKQAADNNGYYQSAGLRFKGIIDNDIKEAATEIGFVVAPSSAISADSDWYKLENGLNDNARAAACYLKGSKDIIYDQGTTQTAYQMILTGLSTQDGKTAYMRRFSAVMYVRTGKTYTYYALGETSYKQIIATYNVMNLDYEKPSDNCELLVVDDSWKSHPQDYKLIAFTFDDGPTATDGSNPNNNQNKIINTLNKYAGAGTLFVIGNNINNYGVGQLQYAIDNGFEIASHTMTHANINSAYLTNRPDYTAQDYIDEQIKPLNDLIKKELNYDVKFLRSSNGTCPQQVIDAAAEMNMPLVFGNQNEAGTTVGLKDYDSSTTSEYIYNQVMNSAYDGKVVLMHGTSSASAEALDDICRDLYIQGYRFVTLSELFEYKLKVTDMSQVDVAASFGGTSGIYDIDDVELKYYNEDQWFLHPEDYKLIAFTFDDGPVYSTVGDNVVTRVIDSFEDYYGAATFFFTGRSLSTYGTAIPEYALSKGHELGNHSYNHATLYDITDKQQTVDEIKKVNDWYKENMNYDCKWFRGAGFSYNDDMWDYLTSIGMPAINYAISHGGDYSGGTATVDSILNVLLNKEIKEGSIIIGHSTKSDGVVPDALAIALPVLYEQGYRFCTLTQLFELQGIEYEDIPTGKYIKGVTVENGVAVYSFN
ncbi:MAG: polysaccharide deacetylase family protein [Clostridia bacterium]|nr:polysaccharide deacetylase family protein [Clostridia bacterium]